ncbi:MAG: hypothetical protein BWY95_01908 [Bacteroidetes bacterium ADurb.BinA104]|nr:MAG: hypothetical protein BWY95_01908 [Bacteroidetes bacterium ADurb.BinA104]
MDWGVQLISVSRISVVCIHLLPALTQVIFVKLRSVASHWPMRQIRTSVRESRLTVTTPIFARLTPAPVMLAASTPRWNAIRRDCTVKPTSVIQSLVNARLGLGIAMILTTVRQIHVMTMRVVLTSLTQQSAKAATMIRTVHRQNLA